MLTFPNRTKESSPSRVFSSVSYFSPFQLKLKIEASFWIPPSLPPAPHPSISKPSVNPVHGTVSDTALSAASPASSLSSHHPSHGHLLWISTSIF